MDAMSAKQYNFGPGSRVVEKISGNTGEIIKVHESWGVEVFNADRMYEKEQWGWSMIAVRTPRYIRRRPRPLRYPRHKPTEQCHCKIGKMEVVGELQVKCLRCKYLIGSESFPNRINRASELLRKTYSWQSVKTRPRRQVRTRVGGRKRSVFRGAQKSVKRKR